MTIRVHLIRTQRPHWGEHSGINQFTRYLDPNRFQIDVYVASDSDADFPFQNKKLQEWLRNRVQKGGLHYYKLSDLVAETRAAMRCISSKVSILHYMDGEHSAQYLPRLFGYLGARTPKLIATFHQPPEILTRLTNKHIISKLDHVIVVSPQQIAYFRRLLPEDRISLILHGIDTNFFRPGNSEKKGYKFRCITVGHWLRDFKVIREVAESLANREDIEFHVVTSKLTGPGLTGLEDLQNVSLFRDTIDDHELLAQYQRADLVFLPLLGATANNALLEGIACGLPILSTDLPSVKTYVPGKEALLIQDNHAGEFAEAILHLMSYPRIRREMSQEARKRAEQLDWRQIIPQYEAVYANSVLR